MAMQAVAFRHIVDYVEAIILLGGKASLVVYDLVVLGPVGKQRSLKLGNSPSHHNTVYSFSSKHSAELSPVERVSLKPLYCTVPLQVHLIMRANRMEDVFLNAHCSSIPKQFWIPREVEEGWGIP